MKLSHNGKKPNQSLRNHKVLHPRGYYILKYVFRITFIDQIGKEAKLRPTPGTGKYNLEKPLKEQLADI
jgi:hypothetical protein